MQTGGNRFNVTYEKIELFKDHLDGLIVPAGLTSRVCEALRGDGHTVEFEDLRERVLGEPNYARIGPLRELQDNVLASVICNDGGIIDAPTGAGKSFLIRLMTRMWPKAKVIIACYSADIVRGLHAELQEALPPDQLGLVGAGHNEGERRVVCAVDKSIGKCDLEGCDIFIYDEVHRAAAEKTKEIIARISNARFYGFSASWKGRADRADLETEAMFGPVICSLTYEEVQKTGSIVPLMVYKVDTAHFKSVEAQTDSALERHGIWRCDDRNRLIKEACDFIRKSFDPEIQILITVKTIEHAVYLGSLLPDFKLVYATMAPDKRIRWERAGLIKPGDHPLTSDMREQARKDFRSGALRRAIATGVWGTGVDFPGLQVLVRGDAQAGIIASTQLPGRACRAAEGKNFGIIVDFNDLHNKTLTNRAERRFAHYRKKGWHLHSLCFSAYPQFEAQG